MIRSLLTLVFSILFTQLLPAQHPALTRQSSAEILFFRVNAEQAAALARSELTVFDSTLFESKPIFKWDSWVPLPDSVLNQHLEVGHFLQVSAQEHQMKVEWVTKSNVWFHLDQNGRDLAIYVYDTLGTLVSNAQVKVGSKKLKFDAKTQSYRHHKSSKQGVLSIGYEGFTTYGVIDRGYNQTFLSKTGRRIFQGIPIRYVWHPFYDGYQSIRNHYPVGMIYDVVQKFNELFVDGKEARSWTVFNKPMFRPGDTVKLKVVSRKRSGRPYNRPAVLYNGSKKISPTLYPDRFGGYQYQFILHDSLEFRLDQRIYLRLESAKGLLTLGRGSFQYEDYQLKTNTYTLKEDHNTAANEPPTLLLSGKDENDLPLGDVRVKLFGLTRDADNFENAHTLISDTLFVHEMELNPYDTTRWPIPRHYFPASDVEFKVIGHFLNSNNELTIKELDVNYHPVFEEYKMEWTSPDSIKLDYLIDGISQKKQVILSEYAMDRWRSKPVVLPFIFNYDPKVARYRLLAAGDSTYILETHHLHKYESQLLPQANRTADSLILEVSNPRGVAFRYQLFRNRHIIVSGYDKTFKWKDKVNSSDSYFLYYAYWWAGEWRDDQVSIPYYKQKLNVSWEHPPSVLPGSTHKMRIKVTNSKQQPVKNVSLTASAITKKFRDYRPSEVPYFGRIQNSRGFYNSFNDDALKKHTRTYIDRGLWYTKLGLDTINFYRFILPGSKTFTYKEPQTTTEFAPFLFSKGEQVPIHVIYLDQKPLYFSKVTGVNRYAFEVTPGHHKLKMRTANELVEVEIYIEANQRHIFSYDLDENPQLVVNSKPCELTESERQQLSKYFMEVEEPLQDRFRYFKQDQRHFVFYNASNRYGQQYQLIGPVTEGSIEYWQGRSKTFQFFFEPYYRYAFKSEKIKMYHKKDLLKRYSSLCSNQSSAGFNDSVLDSAQLAGLRAMYYVQRAQKAKEVKYFNPARTDRGYGRIIYRGKSLDRPQYILLFDMNDPNFLRINPAGKTTLHQLDSGRYRIIALLQNRKYVVLDSVEVKANSSTYLYPKTHNLNPPDSLSFTLDSLIHQGLEAVVSGKGSLMKELSHLKIMHAQRYGNYGRYGRLIQGQIKSNDDNEGLPGVNVLLKGTTTGTVTDMEGYFSLYVPEGSTLVVSFVGYTAKEIDTKQFQKGSFYLQSDVQQLSEVVVTGYAFTTRRSLTASFASLNQLQGRTAGVQVKVRGAASLSQSASQPLVVVDGVVTDSLSINEDEIASTSFLHGAQAVSIYGSRAASGVLLVATKSGPGFDKAYAHLLPGTASDEGTSLRNNFADYAFWQPGLVTNERGIAEFEVTFPDDITNWRTAVYAIDGGKKTGFGESYIRSFKNVSAKLEVPRFLVQGDSAQVLGKLSNYTDSTLFMRANLKYSDHEYSYSDSLNLSRVDKGWITTKPEEDTLEVIYQLQHGPDYKDGEQRSLRVFPKGVRVDNGHFLSLDQDIDTAVHLPADKPVRVYAEEHPLKLLLKEIERVDHYPYYCNEQMASKLMLLLIQQKVYEQQERNFSKKPEIRRLIKRLKANQNQDGMWGWWANNPSELWIAQHVISALLNSKHQGYDADFDAASLISSLQWQLPAADSVAKVQIISMLYKLGISSDALIPDVPLMQYSVEGIHTYVVWLNLRQQLGLDINIQPVLQAARSTQFGGVYWSTGNTAVTKTSVKLTTDIYRLLNDSLKRTVRMYLLAQRNTQGWRNTYESATIISALWEDLKSSVDSPQKGLLIINGREIDVFPYVAEIEPGSISIKKEGDAWNFITLYQGYWQPQPASKTDQFAVTSWFEHNGDTMGQLMAGVPVKLKVQVQVKAHSDRVMIEIPIPAGCSVIKDSGYKPFEVHRSYKREKVAIFCRTLTPGRYTFEVELVPQFNGTYTLNPAKVELMYFPTFYGHNQVKQVRIEDE